MRKRKFVRSFFVILLIAGGVFAYNNPSVKNQVATMFHLYGGSVKGINTKRADGITNQLTTDMNQQIDQAKKQAMNIKISDVINFFNHTQKVANDFKNMQNYVKTEVSSISAQKKK